MKRNLYGNRMFVADLILITLWAIFFAKAMPGNWMVLWMPLVVRGALSFQMRRRSPWSLISAVAFGCIYAGMEPISVPCVKMTRILGAIFHIDALAAPVLDFPETLTFKVVFGVIFGLISLWLVVMPIVMSLSFRNVQNIGWRKHWVQVYAAFIVALGAYITYDEGIIGIMVFGLFIALLPAIYWMIYNRKGRSVAQLLISNKTLMWYCAFLAYVKIALTIGLTGVYYWQMFGLVAMPPLLYVMLAKVMHLNKVLTRVCVALAAAGAFYLLWFDFEVPYVALAAAVALCVYAGVAAYRSSKSWALAGILALGVPAVVAPCIMGLNPYAVMNAERTKLFDIQTGRFGVYIVKCRLKTPNNESGKLPEYYGFGYGIRDRYGLVLPMVYKDLEVLGNNGDYIKVETFNIKKPTAVGVYDLEHNRWIINPEKGAVRRMELVGNGEYALYDADERHFAMLLLPGTHGGEYYDTADFVPHFTDSIVSTEEFIKIATAIEPIPDGYYWEVAEVNNPDGYRLLTQMLMINEVNPSALNNLNYARAVKQLVKDNPCYEGDLHSAMTELDKLCNYGTASGSTSDANQYYAYQCLFCFVEFMQKYDDLLSAFPDNKPLFDEYEAWSNLIQTMSLRLVDMYEQSGRYDAEDITRFKKAWFAVREGGIPTELAILKGKSSYTVPTAEATKLKTDKDFEDVFATYAPYPDGSDYQDSMYTEVRPAFNDWRKAREAVAKSLPANQARSYREYTRVMTDAIFKTIKGLDWVEFRPAR